MVVPSTTWMRYTSLASAAALNRCRLAPLYDECGPWEEEDDVVERSDVVALEMSSSRSVTCVVAVLVAVLCSVIAS